MNNNFNIIVEKLKRMKKPNNNVNFIPRQTLSIRINNEIYYISLICDNNFQVQVVVLDKNNSVIYKVLDLDGDRASIVKLQNNLYVFTDNTAYIYNINNLKDKPIKLFLGNLDLQGICSNQNDIFAYSIAKDRIIKYDKNLLTIQEYENPYSKGNLHISLSLACNESKFFSIPKMVSTEEQYILMKQFMERYVGSEIAHQNDMISSCSFNIDENTLYISMYNLIWIIKDGVEFSYLHFKDSAITTVFYDNDIRKLIINFGGTKKNHVNGSIIKLSDIEIKENATILNSINQTFQYSEYLIDDNVNEIGPRKNR